MVLPPRKKKYIPGLWQQPPIAKLVKGPNLLDVLLTDSPGTAISSDSGGGKTRTMELMLTGLAKIGQPFWYYDITGNSARRMERIIADLPERQRRNFLIIRH